MNAESLPLSISEVDRSAPAPSPFLPGTKVQYAWDSTCLGMIKTCPRMYQYTMIEGWSPREDSVHLFFGQVFHSALEEFDRALASGAKRGEALRTAVATVVSATVGWNPSQESKAGRYKNRDTLLALVIDYLDHFKDDAAETFLLEDGRPAVELSFRFELDWGPKTGITYKEIEGFKGSPFEGCVETDTSQPYLLCGHLDRVVNYNNQLFVMDRKTTTVAPSDYYFDQYEPNNQMTLYTLASRVILGSPVQGVIIDAAQILLDKPNRFVRGMTFRTAEQLDEWLADLHWWLDTAERFALEGHWPQNDLSCDKFGGCRFRKVCSKSPGVRGRWLESDFVQKPEEERWNPLKPR